MIFEDANEALLKLLDRLGFLSCQIVNRQRWSRVVQRENLEPYFNNYVQLYIMARMLVTNPRWMFLAEKCVGFRSDNDSFRTLGAFGRLKMDVCGYKKGWRQLQLLLRSKCF
jgi:abequosyltransferase